MLGDRGTMASRTARYKGGPIGVHCARDFVGEHMAEVNPLGSERGYLSIEVLARSAHLRVPQNRCHSTYRLIALRQRGSETRAVRQETRHSDLDDAGTCSDTWAG